jgi:hypothetical protein
LEPVFLRASAAHRNIGPRPATDFGVWRDEKLKIAYLLGYDDAEEFYRFGIDSELKPLCADAGKAWIENFDRKTPMPANATIQQNMQGIDEFYKNWKNQRVELHYAQIIVRMQIIGRPASEIEDATRKTRAASNE